MIAKTLLLLIYLFLPLFAYCSTDTGRQSPIIQFNKDDGLSTNDIYLCIQDKYGYMWIGTKQGVIKYNGYSFKIFKISFQQGKSSEKPVCIIEDNGVGRERSRQLKKDSTIEKDESYGTTLTKKLIDIFKEYEKMDIYLEYVDKQYLRQEPLLN